MLSIPEKNEPVQFAHGWELLLPTHPVLTRAQELYREADETWKRGTKLADTDPDAAKECYESARLLEAAAMQEETCTCSERWEKAPWWARVKVWGLGVVNRLIRKTANRRGNRDL